MNGFKNELNLSIGRGGQSVFQQREKVKDREKIEHVRTQKYLKSRWRAVVNGICRHEAGKRSEGPINKDLANSFFFPNWENGKPFQRVYRP